MKPGDLIKYPYRGQHGVKVGPAVCFAIVLHLHDAGGVTKAHILEDGKVAWLVTSDCEVINESR